MTTFKELSVLILLSTCLANRIKCPAFVKYFIAFIFTFKIEYTRWRLVPAVSVSFKSKSCSMTFYDTRSKVFLNPIIINAVSWNDNEMLGTVLGLGLKRCERL